MSSKVAPGSIPDKITYICKAEQEVNVGCMWDIDYFDNQKTVKAKVLPSFPIATGDLKTLEKAKSWAVTSTYDEITGQYVRKNNHTIVDKDNKPLKNVKILSLEIRRNGGRAYKALVDNFYVDLREDVVMDTILKSGVDPGGILKGEYIWAKMGANMNLIRVGSEVHNLVCEYENKSKIKPVGKNALEIGGIYQDKRKNRALFLGYVNTTTMKSESKRVYEYYSVNNAQKQVCSFKFKNKSVKKVMLFYSLYMHETQEKSLEELKNLSNNYRFALKKAHTFIEKIDQVEIPKDIISLIREKNMDKVRKNILVYSGKDQDKFNLKGDGFRLCDCIEYDSDYINIYEYGKVPVPVFDVTKFLLFS